MGTTRVEKDATRAERKAKKRKAENAIPDLPGDLEIAAHDTEKSSKKRKHRDINDAADEPKTEKKVRVEGKKTKKDSVKSIAPSDDADEQPITLQENPAVATTLDGETPKKSKKERKAERKAAEASIAAVVTSTTCAEETNDQQGLSESIPQLQEGSTEPKKSKNNRNREKKRKLVNGISGNAHSADGAGKKAARFIVFIGNLPFTATTASIEKHFAVVKPKSVRHLTRKEDPTKSKGCAFIEFDGYDHMKTCLKQFHHSTFDDGLSAPRKINVELTAGGGGKTKHRIDKIGEKNQKLNEERIRRMHEEDKAKLVKKEAAIDHDSVHPSRRARVPDAS